eukprot:IDg17224t1
MRTYALFPEQERPLVSLCFQYSARTLPIGRKKLALFV